MRRAVALTVLLSSVVMAWRVCAFALDPSLDISQYAHTAWKVRDGFTKGIIETIAQTPDGYIWLGTTFGLLRFDGVRAEPWKPPDGEQLPSAHISSLLASRDGTLWIGTRKGLASYKDHKFTLYPEVEGTFIGSILEDQRGTVWFGVYERSKGRLCAIQMGKLACQGEGVFGDMVLALYQDHRGNLWVTTQTGLWRWAPGKPERYAFPRGVTEANSLIEDQPGTLLLATNDGIKQLVSGKIESYSLPGIKGRLRPLRLLQTNDGSLWIAGQQGLLHLHQGRVDGFRAFDGLSGDFVQTMFQDREGDVWAATIEGLDRFREYSIPTISRNQGLSNSAAWSIEATPDGNVWIGSPDGLNRWTKGQAAVYRGQAVLKQNRREDGTGSSGGQAPTAITRSGLVGTPHSLGMDQTGRLWASTSDGVFYFDRDKFIRIPDIPGGQVFSIAGDGHGNVWILNAAGIFFWSPNIATRQIPFPESAQKTAMTMLPDKDPGGLWVGFAEGGVTFLKDGKAIRSYGPADGLGAGTVTQLRYGSKGAVWAATEGGLSRITDGHIVTLNTKNGLPCDQVHWSMEDDNHDVWAYMPCGLVRVASSEWYAWIDDPRHVVRTTIFDISDGARTVASYGGYSPHVTKSPDGRIWFLPMDGVSVIDPRHLTLNKLPPPVQIEKVTADGRTYDAAQGLHLPSYVRNLAIDYTALSFVDPERVHFRYKLEGQDPDWREVVNDRQVQYSNLAPRDYTFRVMASNNSGVWNETGASLQFSVMPAFYQTLWFRTLCAAGLLALLWGVFRLRVQQLQHQFNIALDARVTERTRIARDLHDTLLQSFQGVLLKFHAVTYMLIDRPDAQKKLADVIEQARQAITEGRDAVQGLRSSTLVANDLPRAITMLGEELSSHQPGDPSPVFVVQVAGTPRDLTPILRDDIYRIAGEALRNAFRHAHARRIEVEIRYDLRHLRLRIRDDGKGIDSKVLESGARSGHYGLPGLYERAKLVGGKLVVWSELDLGTEVELTIPAPIAYAKSVLPRSASRRTGT